MILAHALEEHKFSVVQDCVDSKKAALALMGKLNELQDKLSANSHDERMNGRKLTWDYGDRIRWYVFKTPYRSNLPKDVQSPAPEIVYDGKEWTKPTTEN